MILRSSSRGPGIAVAALAFLSLACSSFADQPGPVPPLPVAGDVIAPFDAQGVDGTLKEVAFNGRGSTLLLFFLSSCPTCHRMIPEWNRAFQRRRQGQEVVRVRSARAAPRVVVS